MTTRYDLVPKLEELINHEDNQIAEMAAHAKTIILTNDIVWKGTESSENVQGNSKGVTEEMKQILEDIRDPLLPVRAHGLIMLRLYLSLYVFLVAYNIAEG